MYAFRYSFNRRGVRESGRSIEGATNQLNQLFLSVFGEAVPLLAT